MNFQRGVSWDLTDRVIVVTGAARGIGLAYARAVIGSGARLVAVDLAGCDRLLDEGVDASAADRVIASALDVGDRSAVARLIAEVVGRWGTVDGLVNNAALYAGLTRVPADQLPEDEWDRVLRVNVTGVWNAVSAVLPAMRRQQQGSIVNISSSTILKGSANFLHYVASKGAVWAMTRSLARENGRFGIRVNSVTPGLVSNEGTRSGREPEEVDRLLAVRAQERALAREMSSEDLVGAVMFLLSPASDFMTGQNLNVDGGADFY